MLQTNHLSIQNTKWHRLPAIIVQILRYNSNVCLLLNLLRTVNTELNMRSKNNKNNITIFSQQKRREKKYLHFLYHICFTKLFLWHFVTVTINSLKRNENSFFFTVHKKACHHIVVISATIRIRWRFLNDKKSRIWQMSNLNSDRTV